jgi:ankyrin repeat protein
VLTLASLGADLHARQKDGLTALHLAAKNGWHETYGALAPWHWQAAR